MTSCLQIWRSLILCCALFPAALLYSVANATLIGPSTPYLSASDSPFSGTTFDYFHLDDIEDDLLNTPGVSASAGAPRDRAASVGLIDSVDADDGVIDGSGLDGNSFHISVPSSGPGPIAVTFTFDAIALGLLPTHAGFVLTDITEGTTATFEAFDANGLSLGTLSSDLSSPLQGETSEDQFFGAIDTGGISMLSMRLDLASGAGFELDHIQYGLETSAASMPEPAAFAPFAVGLLCMGVVRRRLSSMGRKRHSSGNQAQVRSPTSS